jgi:hypothetical protein
MLEGIQRAGGINSLKKVDRSQIRDRSGVQVGSGGDSGGANAAPAAAGAPGGGGGMADALAAALQKRKEKVSKSGKLNMRLLVKSDVLTQYNKMTRVTTMTGKLNHIWTKSKRRKEQRGRYSRQRIIDLSFMKSALMGNDEDCDESTSCRHILVANQHQHLRSGLYHQMVLLRL